MCEWTFPRYWGRVVEDGTLDRSKEVPFSDAPLYVSIAWNVSTDWRTLVYTGKGRPCFNFGSVKDWNRNSSSQSITSLAIALFVGSARSVVVYHICLCI